jgi:hypothetical protein
LRRTGNFCCLKSSSRMNLKLHEARAPFSRQLVNLEPIIVLGSSCWRCKLRDWPIQGKLCKRETPVLTTFSGVTPSQPQQNNSNPLNSSHHHLVSFQNVHPSFLRYRKVVERRKGFSGADLRSVTLCANVLQLLSKDFYHLSAAAIELKNTTPNNVAFKVTGKSTHDSATSGLVRNSSRRGDDSNMRVETDKKNVYSWRANTRTNLPVYISSDSQSIRISPRALLIPSISCWTIIRDKHIY